MGTSIVFPIFLIIFIVSVGIGVYIIYLLIKALKKYIGSKEVRQEKQNVKKSLGETIKDYRMRCQMTQEFVAESLGVSRQAVSKWETGVSDPSTSNLFALANLFDIEVEDLLKNMNVKNNSY